MKNLIRFSLILILLLSGLILSCSGDEPEPGPDPGKDDTNGIQSLTLIYAVASNSLSYYLQDDVDEMLIGAADVDLNKNAVLLYSITNKQQPQLSRLRKMKDGNYEFVKLKEYDRSQFSTDPVRISEVIQYALDYAGTKNNGIIFWSHGTGWTPSFSEHAVPQDEETQRKRAFGEDKYLGVSDRCDLIEFARAIPSDAFRYIWFDCCYMGSAEVVAELADKCDYMVACPTELAAEGMPYHITLPLLARKNPDLVKVADASFNYYTNTPVTIAVYDMAKLPLLSDAYRGVASLPSPDDLSSVNNYARRPCGPFYDLGQIASLIAGQNSQAANKVMKALDELVVYKAATARDFAGHQIPADRYSGVSVHVPGTLNAPAEKYYRDLKWYQMCR